MTNAELAENLRAIAECVDDWYFPLGSKPDLWEAARRLEAQNSGCFQNGNNHNEEVLEKVEEAQNEDNSKC